VDAGVSRVLINDLLRAGEARSVKASRRQVICEIALTEYSTTIPTAAVRGAMRTVRAEALSSAGLPDGPRFLVVRYAGNLKKGTWADAHRLHPSELRGIERGLTPYGEWFLTRLAEPAQIGIEAGDRRYRHRMDHEWAVSQLEAFRSVIDDFATQEGMINAKITMANEERAQLFANSKVNRDRLMMLDPGMRILMNVAQAGLGDYTQPPDGGHSFHDPKYWCDIVRPRVLRAIGMHSYGAELRDKMRPDSPDLTAEKFHRWVWEAAAPLWHAGSKQEAVHAAARSVNARLQQKRAHHDKSDAALCRDLFSPDSPKAGHPRLRFSGYSRTSETWRSRQQGAMDFGAGCFEGIRNPAAHEHAMHLPEQVALEQLAAFSLLARWIDECEIEWATDTSASP
jgi:hypothetical protein